MVIMCVRMCARFRVPLHLCVFVCIAPSLSVSQAISVWTYSAVTPVHELNALGIVLVRLSEPRLSVPVQVQLAPEGS